MEDNKTRVLYDRLTQDGYDIGDFDSFSKNVQDEAKRKSLYETITNDGYDVGDFDSFSSKLVARSQEEPVTNVTTQNVHPEQPQVQPVQDMPSYDPKTQGYILDNVPDMFRSKGNNLATRPLPQQDLFENNPSDLVRKIGIDQQQRVEQAQKSANDPYMKEQNLELFKRQNQEQINSVNELINAARQERAKERQQRVRSVGDGGIFSTMSQAYLAGEQNDTDKQLEYASTLMEQAQNITNEAKKKGNTNFFAGFARGFKDAPLDGWAMGLQDLKNYSAAKKVMDKVDKGEELTPSEDALMQALVTNAATQMYYSGDLGRGYKAGGVTAESLPFMLDMIAGMGAVQALTKPASKAIVKYAADKAAQMGLGRATTGLAKGAARTVAGLGDVAAHTATFGSSRVAADYQRRGLGDVQVKPNADGTVSYNGRENVQTGAEALGKSIISTAAETGSELLGEYFAPMLGYIGRVTGANKVGKIIPASVGKAFKDVVNSQGFREIQEIARRAKISDPLGEYAEEVANNLVSTAIGDMTPEQLVDLDQNIDTFLGVAPMSALFGAAGTGGYLRDKYKNYRNMRNFETQMQDAMGEDWSGVREALQDADIETARNMVKDVLSSPMSPDMKKNAIKYISSVLQEQTLQEADKQMMPEEIAVQKRNIINNLNETRSKISLNDEELNSIVNSEEGYQAIISQFDPETANNIMKYKQAYDDFVNYNYWVQDQADNARRQAEAQVESLTNATTGTIMRVNSGLSTNPVNILRGNLVFDNEGKVDENQSDKTIYYMSEDGRVKMAPVSMFSSLVDNTPAEEMIQRAGNDAQEEVLQAEEAQINSIPAQEQQPIGPETRFTMGGNNYEVNRVTPDGYEVYLLDENGTPAQSQLMSEEEIRNAINGQQPASAEETQPSVTEQTVQEETSEQPVQENQTAMSRIPLNERGEQDFEAAPVADTSAALLEISDNVDDAKDTVTQMIEYYNNELKKVEKKKSSGNTIQGIIETKKAKKAINDKISYWNQVAADLEAKRPTGLIAQAEEKAKENQQRLASMTAEEQQAAQQEVQKKIDAGAFERKEPRKKVRYVKEDADLGPSITPQEHVLREIATGRVSFSLSDTEGAQGLSSHLGYSNSPEERKKLVWALSSDGLTPEAAAEQIHADMPENLQGMVTDQDVFNMIINAFQEYGSPSKMWDAAKNMHGTDIEENIPGYEEDQERQLIEWEASENRMSVPEWIAYSDYIEEELNNLYSSVTDEELNTIFEQIINDYERRAETESAGSTEGQTDSEQGNTVQPERESDNEGRTGKVEEQPEPANKTDGESGSVVPEPEGIRKKIDLMSEQGSKKDLQIVRDAVGKTFQSKNGDYMTIENYRTNWDERKKLHGVTYNIDGEIQKKNVFISELANALTSGNWKEVQNQNKTVKKGDIVSFNGSGRYKVLFTETKDGEKYATIENLENKKMPSISTEIGNLSPAIGDIEAARAEVDQNPTEAQKEAGNYKKGHVKIDGYDVTIENPKGSVRSGKDADGNEWSVTMNNDYGYIRGTEGVDGDHIDVFLSDNPETGDVFVIDQVNPDGTFDEHKVMYGFKSALAAKRAYMANYSKGWTGLGNITRVSKEEFKKWVNSSHRKTKPFAEYKSVVPVSEKETTTNAEDTPAKSNNIVSDERYQELKNRLKQKLGQLNVGIDPEIIAIGAEMAVYHIERGAVKFADYCKAMVDDLGDVIRPYLKSFYSSARYMPQSIENGLSERMSPDSEVSQFDVTNFDKSVPDVMQQIENVAKEKEIEKSTSSDDVKKSPSDLFGNSEEYQKKAEQEKEAVSIIGVKIAEKAIAKRNGEQVDPLTMKEVKDILKGYDMLSDMSATDMQELVELAMTNETRLIAESYINGDATKQKKGYDTIVDMYNMQPLLNARDSTRFERQQYSTPTPFGYVMGQFVKDGKTVESVLEPSAGNGALTIAFPANTVHVNDIDERRLENLRTLEYAQVTNQDALIPFEGSVDAVLTNPPFGSTTAKEFDDGQIKISSLEGLMAINALESMKDNGRAAIVIGGNTSYRDNGAMQSKDMRLFVYLCSHYNVVDVINLNGDMYKRNGTKYDVRIILINGRKTGPFKLIAPPVKSKARAEQINSFEELYNRVQDDIRSLQQMGDLFNGTEGETRTTDTEGSGANNNVSNRPKSGERGQSVRSDKKVGSDNDMGSTGNTTVSGPEQAERSTAEENAGKLDNADRSDAGSVEPVQEQRGSDNGGSTGGSRNDGSIRSDSGDNTGRSRLSVNLSDEKVPYPNRSQSGTLMSVVPANQAQVLADSLANIGDVDQFLVDQLGYSSKDELFSYLAAEQIDSVSLAINQMNKGNGFIIGDMTGVGKGRQGAALIRYAVRKGYNPIYFTQKPALFSDNYRDLADIGSGDLKPFIIASDPKNAAITDASGNVVHKLPTNKEKKRVFDYIMKNGKLPEEYDYVITTYSQINNGTKEYEPKEDGIAEKDKSHKKKSPSATEKSGQERRDVIQALSKDNIMILDESHTAGGSGGGSMYMQYIMPKVKGVTFLSATFAKRADNMPIYAMKTDLSKSGISPQDMIEAISQGGVTLQEIMSKQLVQSGQMIRRERSFQGVTIDWMPVSEEEDAVQRKQFDEVSSIFSDIGAFQKDYITPIVEGISEELSEEGSYSDLQQGTAELGVTNTPFASKMYNLVNQLLFSLKADAVANRVIENLKNGFKPVISFTNTMEGFLDEAPKDAPMDKVPNFSATLMRALDGVMRYTETNLKGEKENKFFTVNDLPEAGQNKYYEIREKIENLSADLPISPMDAIKMKIQKAGYNVGEITGRKLEMVQDENGKYIIHNRKDRDKKSAARDFNNGQLDVLMVNKSGCTGISLHASPKFEDQRQRVMVFAQFQSDINDEVQMRGRIDRTGQKFRGKYEYIMSSIPAEQRLQMMFKAKLKSLDANTTSSQKSKFNEMEVVDYLNKYGDDVTWQYMLEHPELSEKLGDPLKILTSEGEEAQSGDTNTAGKEGCAAKIARYLPFLPVKEQEEVFKDITDAYNVKIQLLNDAGENDLEITTMPLKAQTISKKIWKPGTDPNSGNAFADNTYLEEVEVDVLKKPMKAEEIKSTVSRMTSGEPFNEWLDNRVKEINSLYDGKIATLKERLDQSALERSEKAKKNYIEKSKEARKNGKNEFTDEEIEKMSEVVVEDIMKKSKESFIKNKNVIEARRENIRKQINSFTPMKPLVIPFNLDETLVTIMPSRGMFLGYKFSKDYSPSSSTAIFATLDGRRKVEIPLNQEKAFNSIRMNTMMQPTYLKDLNVDTWDSYVPTQTRKKAYIVTGNLLQALVDTKKSENVKGYLVSYSTIEGDTKQGILMSDNFKPENLTTSAPISSRLIQIQQGETVISEDKRVIVEKNTGWRSGYALKVPKSKKQGGEFFEDNKLRSLADNKEFTTRGNYMVADISSDNLSKVLDRLSKMGVTVSKKAKLENSEDVRFRVSEENQDLNNIKSEDVEETAKKLNIPLEVITSIDQIKDNSVRSAIEKGRKVKGWYSLSDNKVYVYLPNATSMEDVNQTILHEGVAHYGLRQLVGEERMDDFLDDVFANVTDEVRKKIIDTLPRYGYNSRIATEEYMARMAENGVDVSVWQRIKQAFNSLMRRMGINIKISDNELRYILWRSRQNLDKNKPLDLAKDVAMQYQMGVGNYFREVDQTPEQSIIDAWDNIASSTMFSLRESTVDYLTAIDKFQDLISKRTGEEIKSFENAYDSMTFLSSKNRVEMDWYDSNIVTPMRKAILELVGKQKGRKWDWKKGELRKLVMYVEAKHGAERNRQMAIEKYIKELKPESLKFFENAGISIDRDKYKEDLKKAKEEAGKKAYDKSFQSIYDKLINEGLQKEEAESQAKKRAKVIADRAESNASEKFRNDFRDKLMKEYSEKVMSDWNDTKKRISKQKDISWIEKQRELDREASRIGADLSQDYSGLSSVFGDEKEYPDGWYESSLNFVEEYENNHNEISIGDLWKSISQATDYTLNKQYESGLVSKEYVDRQKQRFENYIPLRGFQDEIAGDVYNYIGNDFYPGSNPVKSAEGRTSEAGNPFGSILNTGYSTISVGNKNLAKMSLYSLVNNHDTEGLAVSNRAWMVRYDKLMQDDDLMEALVIPSIEAGEDIPEWVEAVPKYPEGDISSEEVSRIWGRFEDLMKKNSKEGYAKPISKRSRIAYRTLYKERSEHEIPLYILGDKYVITITGNPRVAQAMNGLLNPNVNNKGWAEIGERMQRFMAGAFTAKNAAFSIANLTKDSMYANNQVFIKENIPYWIKFTKKQKAGFGDFIPMMMRLKKYRDGNLDLSDETNKMFKEFMDNGGATGYTFVDTQEKYAKELADKLKELSKSKFKVADPRKLITAFFDSVEFTGQAAELVNRFAAYQTSRDMGRSVTRSIRDAKEITVNFNRKGAGMKSWDDKKSLFDVTNMAAFFSQYGRAYILFWNANMQAKYRFYKNIKEHPIKTSTTLIGSSMMFASVLVPFMNNFVLPALYEMFGIGSGDDDEDYYNTLTDWERTHNICIRLPYGNWLKIPLSPEMSPWYTIGDCIGGAIAGQRELSASDFIKSGIDAISPLSINWSYEGANVILNVLPTISQPVAQVAMNVNFMGNPIKKQPFTMRQGFAPQYTMVYGNTSPALIELSRLSNKLTGGTDSKTSGSLDWNPALLQNVITGYTGGYGSSFLSAADWIVSTLKGEEQSSTIGKMPLVSRFFISGNKDVKIRRINSSFYDVIKFTEEFKFDQKSLENQMNNSLKEGNKEEYMKSKKQLEELLKSDRAKKYIQLDNIVDSTKDFEKYLKEMPDDETTQGMLYQLKSKGLEILKK
jgi:hypothetical protein